jgi:NADPH:quinone reductase-like Zn-dependent oxidoreductase
MTGSAMKAVVFREHGGPERLEIAEVPVPAVASTGVLVEVRACALNHLDLWTLQGLPGLRIEMPHVLGNDISGVVKTIGREVSHLAVGDRIIVAPGLSCGHCAQCLSGQDNLCSAFNIIGHRVNGGLAQFVSIPAANALAMPGRLDFVQGAAVPLTFLTAWHMLVTRAHLQPGEDVLVLAAGSGVGSAAIQIAKLVGARVIATAGNEQKLELARRLGADETIHHYDQRISEVVKKITNRKGVEVVVEHVGSATWDESMRSLASNGRLVTCGATTGHEARLDLRHVFYRQLTVLGSMMGRKAELLQLLQFFDSGRLQPVVDKIYTMEETSKAFERLKASRHFGKVVVEVSRERRPSISGP